MFCYVEIVEAVNLATCLYLYIKYQPFENTDISIFE